MSADHIAALEAALQAGPTDGPWDHRLTTVYRRRSDGFYPIAEMLPFVESKATAAYIAAVNPSAIRAVLAEVKRLQAENFALAAGQCANVTGDEGGAPICEEVQRLREELSASEARANLHADLGRRTAEALGLTDEEGRAHMPEVAAGLRADAERLQWLLDHPHWSISYRIRSGKAKDYRMREEGEYWGQWWPTERQAIDAAMKETKE